MMALIALIVACVSLAGNALIIAGFVLGKRRVEKAMSTAMSGAFSALLGNTHPATVPPTPITWTPLSPEGKPAPVDPPQGPQAL